MITITGMPARIALTGATWWHSTGAIVSSAERAPECTGITGIGATRIPIAIDEASTENCSIQNSFGEAAAIELFPKSAQQLAANRCV